MPKSYGKLEGKISEEYIQAFISVLENSSGVYF